MKITAIVPAAGSGSRYSTNKNKLLELLSDKPVIINTLNVLASVEEIDEIIICTSTDLIDDIKFLVKKFRISKATQIIIGGKTRQESVYLGLKEANLSKSKPELVLIHDGARSLITKEIIQSSIRTAKDKGSAVVAVPTKDTIKKVCSQENLITQTLNRSELWNIQTPQVFHFSEIFYAHNKYKGHDFTDDAALLEGIGKPVFVVMGSYRNIKITTEEDLKIAKALNE